MDEMNNKEPVKNVNEEVNKELIKLQETISGLNGLNVDHKRTLHDCYFEYFDNKVVEFQNFEKQIGLLCKLHRSKVSTEIEMQIKKYEFVTQHRNDLLLNITKSFDCIKNEGFGVVHSYTSYTNYKVQTHTRRDNFIEFLLKEFDNCGNAIPMIGYGILASVHSPSKAKLEMEIDIYPAVVAYPKLDVYPIVDVCPTVDVCQTVDVCPTVDVYPFTTDDAVNSNQSFVHPYYISSNIPPRLRFKRHFSLMTKPVSSCTGDTYSSDIEIKRKREMNINNNAK